MRFCSQIKPTVGEIANVQIASKGSLVRSRLNNENEKVRRSTDCGFCGYVLWTPGIGWRCARRRTGVRAELHDCYWRLDRLTVVRSLVREAQGSLSCSSRLIDGTAVAELMK